MFNPSRIRLEAAVADFAKSTPASSLILDAGAGDCPYRSLFGHAKYESADFGQVTKKKYGEITYVCRLDSIPVEDARFDRILFTQTLEHLPNPAAVLAELYRVLKPGGRMFISAPFYYEEHEVPYDFFRYTRYGFRTLIEGAGFKIEELTELEGYFGTLSYQMEVAARSLPRRAHRYGGGLSGVLAAGLAIVMKPCARILARIYANLELRVKFVAAGHCKNYCALAAKPG